jgi:hypothetical protein
MLALPIQIKDNGVFNRFCLLVCFKAVHIESMSMARADSRYSEFQFMESYISQLLGAWMLELDWGPFLALPLTAESWRSCYTAL